MKVALSILILIVVMLVAACADQPTNPIVETEVIYIPVPMDMSIGRYYYFIIDGDTLFDARLKWAEPDSNSTNGWLYLDFGCESGCISLIIAHSPE